MESYSKLLSVKKRLFRLIDVSPSIMMIDKDGIPNTISVDRAIVGPAARETPTDGDRAKANEADVEGEQGHAGDMRLKEENATNILQKYCVDSIVSKVRKSNNVKYVVRRPGYAPTDDMADSPPQLFERFITCCWNDQRRQRRNKELGATRDPGQTPLYRRGC